MTKTQLFMKTLLREINRYNFCATKKIRGLRASFLRIFYTLLYGEQLAYSVKAPKLIFGESRFKLGTVSFIFLRRFYNLLYGEKTKFCLNLKGEKS